MVSDPLTAAINGGQSTPAPTAAPQGVPDPLTAAIQSPPKAAPATMPAPMKGSVGSSSGFAPLDPLTQAIKVPAPVSNTTFGPLVTQTESKYNLPPGLLDGVIKAESGYTNPGPNSKGATGIAQFTPDTAKAFGIDPTDPNQSIDAAGKYLQQLLTQFHGNIGNALAGYNSGPGNVTKYGGVPPFAETQAYVKKILAGLPAFVNPNPAATANQHVQVRNATNDGVYSNPNSAAQAQQQVDLIHQLSAITQPTPLQQVGNFITDNLGPGLQKIQSIGPGILNALDESQMTLGGQQARTPQQKAQEQQEYAQDHPVLNLVQQIGAQGPVYGIPGVGAGLMAAGFAHGAGTTLQGHVGAGALEMAENAFPAAVSHLAIPAISSLFHEATTPYAPVDLEGTATPHGATPEPTLPPTEAPPTRLIGGKPVPLPPEQAQTYDSALQDLVSAKTKAQTVTDPVQQQAMLDLAAHEFQNRVEPLGDERTTQAPANSGGNTPQVGIGDQSGILAPTEGTLSNERLPGIEPGTEVPVQPSTSGAEPTGLPVGDTTGLANQVLEREVAGGQLPRMPESGETVSPEQAQAAGVGKIPDIESAEALGQKVASGELPFNSDNVGQALEGQRIFKQAINAASADVDAAVQGGAGENLIASKKANLQDLIGRQMAYLDDIQKGKTEWHNTGMALQAGVETDTGNFADVLQSAHAAKGEPLVPKEVDAVKGSVDKVNDAQHALAQEVEAHNQTKAQVEFLRQQLAGRSATRATARAALDDEFAGLQKALARATGKLSAGVDPEAMQIFAKMVANRIKAGANTIAEAVDSVFQIAREHVPALTPRDIRNAFAKYGTPDDESFTKLTNRIASLSRQIEDHENGIRPEAKESTYEPLEHQTYLNNLKQLDRLKEQLAEAQATGQVSTKPVEPKMTSPRIEAVQAQIEDIKGQIKQAVDTSDQTSYNKLVKRLTNLNKQVADWEAGERPPPPKEGAGPLETQTYLNKLKALDRVQSKTAAIEANKGPIEKVQEPQMTSPRIKAAQEQLDLAKLKQKQLLNSFGTQTTLDKWYGTFRGLQRLGILSSPKTLFKAVASNSVAHFGADLEDMLSAPVGKLTGYDKITPEARFSAKAALAAYVEFLKSLTVPKMYNDFKAGTTYVDADAVARGDPNAQLHGKPTLLNFNERLHNAFSGPFQKAAFVREGTKLTEMALDRGMDLNNPDVQANISSAAYAKSLEMVLRNKNAANDVVGSLINGPEKLGTTAGKTATFLLDTQAPVRKLPLNALGRSLEYTPVGAANASKLLLQSLRESLTPEEAGQMVRGFKRSGVGTGLMMAFAFGLKSGFIKTGGYYNPATKSGDNGLNPGEVMIGSYKLPDWLTETPIFQPLDMVEAIMDGYGHGRSAGDVAMRVGTGMAERVPLLGSAIEGAKAIGEGTNRMGVYLGRQAAGFVPISAAVQQLAEYLDNRGGSQPIQRSPEGFTDEAKMHVPDLGINHNYSRSVVPPKQE